MCLQWPSEADKLHLRSPLVSWCFSFASCLRRGEKKGLSSSLFSLCRISVVCMSPWVLFFRLFLLSMLTHSWTLCNKGLGVNWTIVTHLFHIKHCYLGGGGVIRGMFYTKPAPCNLTSFLPYKCLRLHINATEDNAIHLYSFFVCCHSAVCLCPA